MARAGSHIPLELIAEIIEWLYSEDLDPSASHLFVCRTWTRIAYPHHFRSLRFLATGTLAAGGPIPALMPDLAHPDSSEIFAFEHLLAFLQRAPMVCQCVEKLSLKGRLAIQESVPLDLDTLSAILHHLPKLKILHLNAAWSSAMSTCPSYPPVCLQELLLGRNVDVRRSAMGSLFSLLAFVDKLHVNDARIAHDPHATALPNGRLAIKFLSLGATWYYQLEGWAHDLQLLLDTRSLETLHIITPEREPFENDQLPQIMDAVGLSLREFAYSWIEREDPTHLDLSKCTDLEIVDLTMSVPALGVIPMWDASLIAGSWLSAMGTFIHAPPSIHTMLLSFMCVDEAYGDEDDNEDINANPSLSLSDMETFLLTLNWSLLERAVDKHAGLIKVEIKLLTGGIDVDGDLREFARKLKGEVQKRCFRSPERRHMLEVVFS